MAIADTVKEFIINGVSSLDDSVTQISNILKTDVFATYWNGSGGEINPFGTIINSFYPCTLNLAYTIIAAFFFVDFIKTTMKMDIMRVEYGLTCFFKFVFARVAIEASTRLMAAFLATATSWINYAMSINVSNSSDTFSHICSTAITTIWEDLETIEAVLMFGIMLIPILFIKIVGVVGIVLAYTRHFELTMYHCIFPLPCAGIVLDDSRMTKRFFLSYFATALQGVFMILTIKIYEAMLTASFSNLISNAAGDTNISQIMNMGFNMMIASMVLLTGLMKSGRWAEKVLDVG